jgi:peptide/nickel transport system substrate-binding protein
VIRNRRRIAGASISVVLTLVLAAGCGGSSKGGKAAAGAPVQKGSVSYALPATQSPDYIFPLDDSAHYTTVDINYFQDLMWRPLYWFGVGAGPNLNESLSLAKLPVFSKDRRTVTIHLKHYLWSDGTPVTSKDVAFWQTLVTANKQNWGAYVPTEYPDNVASVSTPNASTVVFHLTKAYNPTWFLSNELSQITPLPVQAWNKTSDGAAVSNAPLTKARAVAVYKYLDSASREIDSYTSNPIWKVVDGPWQLSSLNPTTGDVTFNANPKYSGPNKPQIHQFKELGFASQQAELDEVQSRSVNYGYLPFSSLPEKNRLTSLGYTFGAPNSWGVEFFDPNYNDNNTQHAAIFHQLYFRQALEHLMDQQGIISAVFHGQASPNYGPIPSTVPNKYIDAYAKVNHYPYSISTARQLLTSHGWKLTGGVMACAKPGTGAGECGKGINAGSKLTFTMIYESGNPALQQEMSIYKSDAGQAGIDFNLTSEPFSSVVGAHGVCKTGQSNCNWDFINWGGGWGYEPDYYPTGELIFATGGGSNRSNYSDPTNDANIAATQVASGAQAQNALDRYQDYLIQQAPVVWEPNPPLALVLVDNALKGALPVSSVDALTPEAWSTTSK